MPKRPSGPSGHHKPPPPEQIDRIAAIVAEVTADVPADVMPRGRVALAERRLGLRAGALSSGQTRALGEAAKAGIEAAVGKYFDARHGANAAR